MASITATGIPEKYPEMGEIRIYVDGGDVEIENAIFRKMVDGKWMDAPEVEKVFKLDLKRGPSYPLCAEPYTMRCALFILFEWFGEAESCWIEEPKHVILEGEVEPMPYEPGVIY